jgi:outer membrane lipoprotein-sorting protein
MQKITKTLSLFFLLIPFINQAQIDDNSKAIFLNMEKLQKKIQNMSIDFEVKVHNLQSGSISTDTGKAIIQKEKYYINFNNTESFYDGKQLCTFLPEEEEATITTPDNESDNLFNVAKIFEIYKKGHKCQYMGEIIRAQQKLYVVKLFPEKLDEKYRFLTIEVNKKTLLPLSVTYSRKDGIDLGIKLFRIKKNIKINSSIFKFDESKYPDIDIIDMTE